MRKILVAACVAAASLLSTNLSVSAEDEGIFDLSTVREFLSPSITALRPSVAGACTGILSDNIYDTSSVMGYDYHASKLHAWACSSSFTDAQSMRQSALNLGIPIDGIPLSIGFSSDAASFRQSLRQWCTSDQSEMYSQAFRTAHSSTISTAMVSAFEACVETEKDVLLNSYGSYAIATPENKLMDSFLVTLFVRPTILGNVEIESVEGSVECSKNGTALTFPHKLTTAESVFTCAKPSHFGANLSFSLSSVNRSPPIVLPEGGRAELERLRSDILILRTNLDDLQRNLATTREEGITHINLPTAEDHHGNPECTGEYKREYAVCLGDCSSDDARLSVCVKRGKPF